MKVRQAGLPGVLLIEPEIFSDDRGFFFESFSAKYRDVPGMPGRFVQDNLSHSKKDVLRGLHLQHPNEQGKLVSVVSGRVLDVAVDVRAGSPTFGRYAAVELDAIACRQLWIPRGFAHGFLVLSDQATFLYKCDAPYSRADEIGIRWNDPEIGIEWPVHEPLLSAKDEAAPGLKDLMHRLPAYSCSHIYAD
ncbi:MAG: dTDP-4-dehydrorhamnose 3,5-epimerase [Rhodomicrobium sp.]